MRINIVSRGCGQGKTQAALDAMAHATDRHVLAQPSIRLVAQSHAGLLARNPHARAQVITSDTNAGVAQSVREALQRPGFLATSPKRKRARETGEPMTAVLPAWLEIDRTTNTIVPRPDRVALVRRMFELTAEAVGA